jgi:broad specificity phosphatase PhoE
LKIIFVRHGQTTWNAESRYQGHSDSPLSRLGILQAERASERLASEVISAVYSSDLSRAMDTAQIIAAPHNLTPIADCRLREVCFGDWEGLTVGEIRRKYEALFANYRKDSITNRAPNGERLEVLQERVILSVEEISRRHPDGTVVIATHGGPIRAFICHALDADLLTFRKIGLDNAALTCFHLKNGGRWMLERMNDSCHLQGLEPPLGHDETAADKG